MIKDWALKGFQWVWEVELLVWVYFISNTLRGHIRRSSPVWKKTAKFKCKPSDLEREKGESLLLLVSVFRS